MSSSPKILLRHVPKRKASRCMYQKYSCSSVPLPSYLYCEKHISEDKSAPFRQCSYVYPSTRERCSYTVLYTSQAQSRDTGLCKEHTEESEVTRLKPKCKLLPPLSTADTILSNLSHYVKNGPYYKKRDRLVGATADELLEQIEKNKNSVVNPFLDIDSSELNAKTNETLNYSCEADSDIEPATTDNVWDNAEQDSSDPESLDYEMTDPLRHAGVYTDEEIILSARNHAVRIQNLCIQQYRRLLYILRDKRNKYLMELKREKEIYGPLSKPRQMTWREKKQFDQLKALAKYQKIGTGPEALLFKKMLERRKAVTPGLFARSSKNYNKCGYTEGGVRCTLRCLPTTKFCKKHILHDKSQVLFQECGVQKKDHICKEPIVPIPNVTCIYHLSLLSDPDTNNQLSETDESSSADQKVPDIETDSKVKIQGDAFEMLLNYSQKQEMSSNFTSTPS